MAGGPYPPRTPDFPAMVIAATVLFRLLAMSHEGALPLITSSKLASRSAWVIEAGGRRQHDASGSADSQFRAPHFSINGNFYKFTLRLLFLRMEDCSNVFVVWQKCQIHQISITLDNFVLFNF